MMLLPQAFDLGANDSHKPGYFTNSAISPPSVVSASVTSDGHQAVNNAVQGICAYPAGEAYFLPGRMQSEFPGMNVHSSGHPGSSALASPTNYGPVPGTVATAPGIMPPHYGSPSLEHSPYYPQLGAGYESVKSGNGELWTGTYGQTPASYYPYENTFGHQYPYDRYSCMDMNDGVRRKNATRESTNTLKAWLQEHKKNPYPTKSEKIMLAIITKMTLTQVSTWFANARRRLKKENKMTWVPKNRSNDATGDPNDKKTEDDDEVTSQSVDIDSKTDIDQSLDSDDSGDREVSSTNDNDVSNTYPIDSKNFVVERNGNFVSSADVIVPQRNETTFTSPKASSEVSQSQFPPKETLHQTIWSPQNEGEIRFKSERIPQDSQLDTQASIYPDYSIDHYSKSPLVPKLSPDITRNADESHISKEAGYHQGWPESSYSDPARQGIESTQQLPNAVNVRRDNIISNSPEFNQHQYHNIYTPGIPLNNPEIYSKAMFPGKPAQRDNISVSSIGQRITTETSPYMEGFPTQQPTCLPNPPNYGNVETLPPPPCIGSISSSFYQRQDLNSQHEPPQPAVHHHSGGYLPVSDLIQSRTPTTLIGTTGSPSSDSSKSPLPRQQYFGNNPTVSHPPYYAPPITTISPVSHHTDPMYLSSFYQQDVRKLQAQNPGNERTTKHEAPVAVRTYPDYNGINGNNLETRMSSRD